MSVRNRCLLFLKKKPFPQWLLSVSELRGKFKCLSYIIIQISNNFNIPYLNIPYIDNPYFNIPYLLERTCTNICEKSFEKFTSVNLSFTLINNILIRRK